MIRRTSPGGTTSNKRASPSESYADIEQGAAFPKLVVRRAEEQVKDHHSTATSFFGVVGGCCGSGRDRTKVSKSEDGEDLEKEVQSAFAEETSSPGKENNNNNNNNNNDDGLDDGGDDKKKSSSSLLFQDTIMETGRILYNGGVGVCVASSVVITYLMQTGWKSGALAVSHVGAYSMSAHQTEELRQDITRVEGKVDRLEVRVDRLEGKVDRLEGKVDDLRDELRASYAQLRDELRDEIRASNAQMLQLLREELRKERASTTS